MTPVLMGLALSLVATSALAASSKSMSNDDSDISNQLENLGSNKQVKDRAAQLDSRTRVGIVQGRAVDRHWRLEAGASYGGAAFGDPYLNTQNLGANADLHINNQFSIGVHYAKAFSQLTQDGQQQFENARTNFAATPQVSTPQQSIMGVLDWYMTYGKINLFDWRTIQFDFYSLAGFGQEQVLTQTGSDSTDAWTNTWTAGLGMGFWLSNHATLRTEIRYQTYADENGSRNLNLVVGTIGLGFLI